MLAEIKGEQAEEQRNVNHQIKQFQRDAVFAVRHERENDAAFTRSAFSGLGFAITVSAFNGATASKAVSVTDKNFLNMIFPSLRVTRL